MRPTTLHPRRCWRRWICFPLRRWLLVGAVMRCLAPCSNWVRAAWSSIAAWRSGPLALAGFSFGAFVAGAAAVHLTGQRDIRHLVLVGAAASRFALQQVPQPIRVHTLLVHGEQDETVPLTAVMDWARPQNLPVLVLPGCSHFFHGQLPLLRQVIVGGLAGHSASPGV